MTTFQPVNTALAPDTFRRNAESATPTTPRPNTVPNPQYPVNRVDDATTPTRATFGALPSQRPLPAQPFPAAVTMPETASTESTALPQDDSQTPSKSRNSGDVDMDDSGDDEDGSDEESVNPDGTSTKKKRSQKFYCADYPPCTLSFTRSEHLARHIRKHTGERPFQCHCSRRFSRLDNLRQHAQTVHVNEDIPQDSLAATGTRFQRQVRTDRARQQSGRSRASTAGSGVGPVRGHHRNSLSASSITSVQSYVSATDRRRPPPLQMAGSQRHSGEYLQRPDSPGQYQQRPYSPGGYSTPTSATFSTGQSSPRFGSAIQSPVSSHSRTHSLYSDPRNAGRRLSVPSAGNPFQSPHGGYVPAPYMPANTGYSPSSSMMGSPTTPSSSTFSRRESVSSGRDESDFRRRTWHPESNQYQSFNSRLSHVMTPNYYAAGPPPQPPVVPSNAPPISMRLPGIASFDQPRHRPQSPVHREPSPMMIDTPSRAPIRSTEQYREERPGSQHWDQGINRNLNRLDIAHDTPMDGAGTWASETAKAVAAKAEHARVQVTQPTPPQPQVRFEESPYTARTHQNYQHQSAPPITPREAKRHAWYSGPVSPIAQQYVPIDPQLQRTSPADSSSSEGVPGTPSSAAANGYNPVIMHANGHLENQNMMPVHESRVLPSNAPNGYPAYHNQTVNNGNGDPVYAYARGQEPPQHASQPQMTKGADNLSRLDALVAVATNLEKNPTTAY